MNPFNVLDKQVDDVEVVGKEFDLLLVDCNGLGTELVNVEVDGKELIFLLDDRKRRRHRHRSKPIEN